MRPEDLSAWRAKMARIVRVAADEPDMPLCLLSERFGETEAIIGHALRVAGITREHDYFWVGGRRRTS